MHVDHLGPLTDPDCVAYHNNLVAANVMEPDPQNPGSYVVSKNAQRFDRAKALTHFASW